jgi:hypothetical protein
MWTWGRGRPRTFLEADLGDECEAFLAGPVGGAPLSQEELKEIALSLGERCASMDEWRLATSAVAGQLLALAAREGRPVGDLQATVLVPLELDLFHDGPSSSFVPRRLARRVLEALEDHVPPEGR